MIAALYVQTDGCYYGLPDVDPWDLTRDARRYRGPHPVIAHPPCQLWGPLAAVNSARYGGEHNRPGNDGGMLRVSPCVRELLAWCARASSHDARMGCTRIDQACRARLEAQRRRLGVRGVAISLWAPSQQGNMALLRRRATAARASMGPFTGLASGWMARQTRKSRQQADTFQA